MKLDIILERVYSRSIESVWNALIDPEALGEWLMRTDFEPQVGRSFQMWCENPQGGTDRYSCRLLELDPPVRMVWSWLLDGRPQSDETRLQFELSEKPEGTRLVVRHSGKLDPASIDAFEKGWPGKLAVLDTMLGTR